MLYTKAVEGLAFSSDYLWSFSILMEMDGYFDLYVGGRHKI